jgi:hypothetical protein
VQEVLRSRAKLALIVLGCGRFVAMAMVITLPDEEARKLQAAAVRLGVSVDEVARSLVADHLPPISTFARSKALLERFVGSVSGDGLPFDVHDARRELAGRRASQDIRTL